MEPAGSNRQALRDGWLLTGDIGYQDADGYCFITDRKKDMLLVNGINVYPREIEEVIYQFPGVKEVAVIGQPDPPARRTAGGFCRYRDRRIDRGRKSIVEIRARKNWPTTRCRAGWSFPPPCHATQPAKS